MPDLFDHASEIEERERSMALAAQAKRVCPGPRPTGVCLLCDEPVPPGHRWCDLFCRDRWQAECDAAVRAPAVLEEGDEANPGAAGAAH